MKITRLWRCVLVGLVWMSASLGAAQADKGFLAVWKPGDGKYFWHTGMSVAELQAQDAKYFKEGLRIVSLDAYKYSDIPVKISYTALWRPGSGGQWWRVGMSLDQFKAQDATRFGQGYRLAALDVQNGSISAVWRPGSGAQYWTIGSSLSSLQAKDEEHMKQGLRLTMMKKHGGNDCAAVWRPGSGEQRWLAGISTSHFKTKDAEYFKRGLRLVSLDTYDGKWNAVWRPGSGAQWVNWGMSLDRIKQDNAKYVGQGLRPAIIRAKSYQSQPADDANSGAGGSGGNTGTQCTVWATLAVDICYNVDGSVSNVYTPGSRTATGCGPNRQAAEEAAKREIMSFACLTTPQEKKPGCCTYKFK